MYLVGLTGGIATGKSTVANLLRSKHKCPVIDADKIAREVVQPGTIGWKKIKQQFGDDVLQENGEIDREKLGLIIFSDAKKRKLLNSITHPEMYKLMMWKVFKLFITGHQFVILELPLLFETGNMVPYMTFKIVVSCSPEQQLQRLINRNNFTLEEAEKRINSQMPLAEKCKKATHIIDNTGDVETTERQIERLYSELRASKSHWKLRILLTFCVISVLGLTRYLYRYIFH